MRLEAKTARTHPAAAAARSRLLLTVALVLLAALPACRTQDLAFRQDDRLKVLEPRHREMTQLPIRVRWQMDDFRVVRPDGSARADQGHFAVFLDRSPQAPGKSLDSLANDDETCENVPGCPDRQWFEERGIFETAETSVLVDTLADLRPPQQTGARDRHELTIILLNGQRERIGEIAYIREFFVDRSRSPF